MAVPQLARLKAQRETESTRDRAIRDLRFLAVDILGYEWMSGDWHTPVFRWMDERLDHKRVAVFAPRYSYKSRMECAEIIREILRNPNISVALVHHKLDLARELVTEIGEHLQKNEKLRELLPSKHTPHKRTPSFIKTSQGGEFRLPGTSRAKPTLKGFSADQDLTGAHPDILFCDDIISAKTVEYFGGIAGLKNWVEHTLIPLAGASGRIRVKGTMWSPDDWYTDIKESDHWDWICRGILENDQGEVDAKSGKPIKIFVGDPQVEGGKRLLTMEDVQRYKEEMKSHFSGQMLNDPRPEGSRPWNEATCEHFVQLKHIRRYIKKIAVLTDPAPLGMDNQGRLTKPDGTKDYWSIAVIGYLRSRNKTLRVLLDGNASQAWTLDQGLREIKRLMRRWNAKLVGIEEPLAHGGVGFYGKALRDKFGRTEQLMGQRVKPIKFASTQKGKPPRIMDLAAMASMTDEEGDPDPLFVICDETCNSEFLKLFLEQARNWAGKNSLKHDDHLDVVSYLDDPALMEFVRLGGNPLDKFWDEFTDKGAAQAAPARRTRHCPA